jgi:hypothetical protein
VAAGGEAGADVGASSGVDGELRRAATGDGPAAPPTAAAGIEAEHEQVEQHLEHVRDDPRPARAADAADDAIAVEHQHRRHRRQRPLAGADQVLDALAQAVHVGDVGREREVVDLVVEDDAARRDQLGAVVAVDGGGERDRVAVAIDHAQVAGAARARA